MRAVQRDEIVDYLTYTDRREAARPAILEAKRLRRILVGPLCFLFENRETVTYQVQEMMRVERIVREKDILHELKTYNELLGGPGQLGCSLLIGLPDEATRDVKLRAWLGLLLTLYCELPDGTRVRATWDERQVGTDRLSSVQYLMWDLGGVCPVAIGCEFEDDVLVPRLELNEEQVAALTADLAEA
ncbi:MAG: DUF3501 family protein [Proteobacteria bacterium]|nr:DUF3501 family protein [Pseudomonadota bacterium]MCP4915894.1 DUF3501 family protein [Pseudomonadota bacterium]